MKKYSVHSHDVAGALAAFRPSSPDLQFPIAPDFISRPPRLDWDAIVRRCEESLAFKRRQPGFEERRLASKVTEEFVL